LPRGVRTNPKNPIDRGAPASVIADKFGGLKAFATALDMAQSSVHRWLVKGTIDGKYHDAIMAAAKARAVRLKATDFVDTRPQEQRGPSTIELEAATA